MHLEDNHFRRVPRGAHAHGHPIPRVPPPSPHCPLPRGAPSPPPPSQVSLVEARPRRSTERFPISPVFRLRTPSLPMGLWPRFRVSRLCAWGCGDSRGTLGTSRSLGGRWGCPEVWGCWGQWGHPKPGDTLGTLWGHFGDTHQCDPQVRRPCLRHLVVPQHQRHQTAALLPQPLAQIGQAWGHEDKWGQVGMWGQMGTWWGDVGLGAMGMIWGGGGHGNDVRGHWGMGLGSWGCGVAAKGGKWRECGGIWGELGQIWQKFGGVGVDSGEDFGRFGDNLGGLGKIWGILVRTWIRIWGRIFWGNSGKI